MSGGVIAVLVLAIWAMWPSSPATPSAAAPAPAAGAQQTARPNPTAVAPVKIDALASERQAPADSSRNPFRYQPKAPPPAAPRPATTAPPMVDDAPPKPMVPITTPPLPIPLKFIGILERANGVKWAVLSDGKTPMHGREGDIVIGQYRIVKIGTESIEIARVNGGGSQVIRLTGQ
jgi:hypothetical protein